MPWVAVKSLWHSMQHKLTGSLTSWLEAWCRQRFPYVSLYGLLWQNDTVYIACNNKKSSSTNTAACPA